MTTPIAPVDVRHLRYFLAAAQHGSFRKAGMALGIQESSISRRIRDLEDRLGASLFHRYNGGVRLTLAGQRFCCRARAIIRQIGDGAADVSAIGRAEDGHVRIGISVSLATHFLAELLRTFQQRHTGVRLDWIDGDPVEHVALVRQLELDLAIVMGATEWQGCDTKHLWSEQLFVALWNDHPKSRHRKLSWPDIVSEIFIIGEAAQGREFLDRLRERLKTFAEVPMIDTQNVGSDNLLSLVALGHGLTLVNETRAVFPFPGVVFRPVQDETIPFSAVWSPSNDNPALRRLISMAKFLSRNVAAPAKTSES